jgi:hypothetical protein
MVTLDEKYFTIDQVWSSWMRKILLGFHPSGGLPWCKVQNLVFFFSKTFVSNSTARKTRRRIFKFSKTPEITSSNTVLDSWRKLKFNYIKS